MSCDDFINHKCSNCSNNREATAKENKKIYRIINNKSKLFCKIKIDTCYIKEGKRCDFLILDCIENNAFFVELKGKHFEKACEQILSTIKFLEDQISGFTISARIIITHFSHPNDKNRPNKLKLEKKCKENNGKLIIKEKYYEEIIS